MAYKWQLQVKKEYEIKYDKFSFSKLEKLDLNMIWHQQRKH